MREIVLDTETTGLDPKTGDRIVEIGGVELIDHFPTGKSFHTYINPERSMPPEAYAVHGLSEEFLADKPRFAEIADEFLAFIEFDRLVIHNAAFDLGFINSELARLDRPALGWDRALDTLMLARRRHPGAGNRLDDLCSRYGIDASRRTKHGALLDAELLAEVYIELIGGRQAHLTLVDTASPAKTQTGPAQGVGARPAPLPPRLTEAERIAHKAFVESLGENALWRRYEDDGKTAAGD
ncbi:MAG: DNA polymerase III subunit epsilon [Hyphomicrobiales bacterium]|nr:DNA polymerase III subunit epsilon [Hyphomicrobiales bacterium]